MADVLQDPGPPEATRPPNASATEAWRLVLGGLITHGAPRRPRGQLTLEHPGPVSVTVDATRPVLRSRMRRLGYRFMCAEAAWILSGDDRVATIAPYSKEISRFSDDGVRFFGAYGPKIIDQWGHCVGSLVQDPDTRQAVINIWRESPPATKDVPCTLSWQFLLRDGKVNLVATMRSSDIWLGWPYDIFTQAMAIGAMCLGLREAGMEAAPGAICLTAGSQHLYAKDALGAMLAYRDETAEVTDAGSWVFDHAEFRDCPHLVEHLWRVARKDTTVADLDTGFLKDLKFQLDNGLEVG